MYKILIMLRGGNNPVYELYKVTNDNGEYVEWSTSSLEEAQSVYTTLLSIYTTAQLKLISDVATDVQGVIVGGGTTGDYVTLQNIKTEDVATVIACEEKESELQNGYFEISEKEAVFVENEEYAYKIVRVSNLEGDKNVVLCNQNKNGNVQYAFLTKSYGSSISLFGDMMSLSDGLTDIELSEDYKYVLIQGNKEEVENVYALVKRYATFVYPTDEQVTLEVTDINNLWIISYDEVTYEVEGNNELQNN